jgi:hypothetical protein
LLKSANDSVDYQKIPFLRVFKGGSITILGCKSVGEIEEIINSFMDLLETHKQVLYGKLIKRCDVKQNIYASLIAASITVKPIIKDKVLVLRLDEFCEAIKSKYFNFDLFPVLDGEKLKLHFLYNESEKIDVDFIEKTRIKLKFQPHENRDILPKQIIKEEKDIIRRLEKRNSTVRPIVITFCKNASILIGSTNSFKQLNENAPL